MSAFDLIRPMLAAIIASVLVLGVAAIVSLWKREAGRRVAIWLAPAAGFVAGGFFVRGWPPLPPVEATGWLFWGVCLVAIVGCCLPKLPLWACWLGRLVVVAGFVYVILRPLIGRTWEGMEAVVWLAGIGLIWLIAWMAIGQSHRAPRAWAPLVLLLLAAVGLSILLMVAGTASYSQFALALAGVIAGAGLASLPGARRFFPDPRPVAALVAIPWMGLLTAGHFYADLPLVAAVLAFVALFSLGLPSVPKVKTLSSGWLLAVQVGWTILFLAIAIVIANAQAPRFDY